MKVLKSLIVIITISSLLVSCNNKFIIKKSLETAIDTISYAIGIDLAMKLKENFEDVNRDMFIQGYDNGLDSTNLLLEQKDINDIIRSYFQKKQQADALKKAENEFADIKKESEAFLENNKSKDGVYVTDSGLQYIILKEGSGDKPKTSSKVVVHYHGTLIDGTVFDSSVDRGKPYEHVVGQMIPGWIEGVQLMNVGSKYRFFISQELGYGATPRLGVIKPFMTLIFEVELLEIKKK